MIVDTRQVAAALLALAIALPVAANPETASGKSDQIAEIIDLQTQFRQRVALLQGPRGLLGGQIHGFGNQQTLAFQPVGSQPRLQLLEQNSLMKRMLIDDQHAFGRFHDQIGVIELKDLEVAGGRRLGLRTDLR